MNGDDERDIQLYLLITTRLIRDNWTIVARDENGEEQRIEILPAPNGGERQGTEPGS